MSARHRIRRAARAVLLLDEPPARPHPVLDLDALDRLDAVSTGALAAMLAARAITRADSDQLADAIAAALIDGIAEEHTHGRDAVKHAATVAALDNLYNAPAYGENGWNT